MTEQINKYHYFFLNMLPHPILRFLKLHYRYHRFNKFLYDGRRLYEKYAHLYNHQHIIFIAGLPKSGTTWLEKMLSTFPGYTIIPDPDVTVWDYQNGGTHQFELSDIFFSRLKNTLALVKIHSHGSTNNSNILKQMGLPYCIIYRDLRDAAVSYIYYVKRTPWHPEFPVYKKLTIQQGLMHFGSTLLPEWRDWVMSWHKNRDPQNSVIIKYEKLLSNPTDTFKKIVDLFNLPVDDIDSIIENHHFYKMKNKGNFFRKGSSGDWKNHFTDEIKDIFKEHISDFLITEGYESDNAW